VEGAVRPLQKRARSPIINGVTRGSGTLRRLLGWALVASLSIAALAAVVALLSGSFSDTELRVVFTSVGFAVLSSVAAAGAAQRFRASAALRMLGAGTVWAALVAFALLAIGLWTGDWGSEPVWRAFGGTAVVAFAGAHACLVLAARRPGDSGLVRGLVDCSLALGLIDALACIAPISGLTDEVDEGMAKVLAIGLVLLVLTSALPPILRRLQAAPAFTQPALPSLEPPTAARRDALELLTGEVVSIADRIDHLNSSPGVRAPEIRREIERLRSLADKFRG
jgi:hypothetical protein